MLVLDSFINSLVSEGLVLISILLLLFVVFRLGKFMFQIAVGFVINSVLGVVAILVVNYVFLLGIPLSLPIIASTVIFGLPAVGALIILKLGGIALA